MGMTDKQFNAFLSLLIAKHNIAIEKAIKENASKELIDELKSLSEILENAIKD